MRKILFFIGFLFVGAVVPAQAQLQRAVWRGFKKGAHVRPTATLATQRTVNQILRQKLTSTNPCVLSKSTFVLRPDNKAHPEPQHWNNPPATAFIFEEQYNGKTYLWGATASHYLLENPILKIPQTGEEFPVQLVAQGHYGMNDVSLFPIPAQLQGKLKPLKLAPHAPHIQEKLVSAGYFDDSFHVEKGRKVIDFLPTRILTSLTVEDELSREGACGGPVLNKQGNIVGMHVGSSAKKQAGFVVPVENIYEVLQAYHNNGKALRPFYFNGRHIGMLNINEYVQSIEVWKDHKMQDIFLSYRNRARVDYNHLEKLVRFAQADKIIFKIERRPFSVLEENQQPRQFEVTYNLRNFHISRREIRSNPY